MKALPFSLGSSRPFPVLLSVAVGLLLGAGVGHAAIVNVGGFTMGATFPESLTDRAATGAQDSGTYGDGAVDFALRYTNLWSTGTQVTLTGIAFPVRLVTLAGTFTIDVYDHDQGADPELFDGVGVETLVGSATGVLEADLPSPNVVWWNFDAPIQFVSASSGFTVHIRHSASIRFKIANESQATAGSGPYNRRVNAETGTELTSNPVLKLSLAGGIFDPRNKTWYGDKGNAWDTALLNWNSGTSSYLEGDFVIFDDSTVSAGPVTVNLVGDHAPDRVSFLNSAKDYILTGGGIVGETSLSKAGTAVLTLANANNYAGGTTVNGGILKVGAAGALPDGAGKGDVTLAAGTTLDLNGVNEGINGIGGTGTIDNTAGVPATLTVGNDNEVINFPGTIQNSGGALSLAKHGTNAMTLTGSVAHTGATLVQEGTLRIPNATTFTASGGISVSNAATLFLSVTNYVGLAPSSLTLGGGTLEVEYGDLMGSPPFVTPVSVVGPLTLSGVNTITLVGTNFGIGSYPVIGFTSISGAGSFNPKPIVPVGVFARVETNGNAIVVNVTNAVRQLIWYGDKGAGWTTANNWNYGSASYVDYGTVGDVVVFDDSSLVTSVTIPEPVRPSLMVVNNLFVDYTFAGAGRITGPSAILKRGAMNLTLNTANDFEGGCVIESGGVVLGADSAVGSGPITLAGGAILSDGATARSLTNDVVIASASTLGDVTRNGRLTFIGTLDYAGAARDVTVLSDTVFEGTVGNGGFLTKTGPGNIVLRASGEQNIGSWQIGEADIVIDGAVLTKAAGGIRLACQAPLGVSRVVITNGGSLTFLGSGQNIRIGSGADFVGDPSATNIFDLSGELSWSTNSTSGSVQIGASSALSLVNLLPGGVLRTFGFAVQGPNSEVNFSGGTLSPMGNSTTFMQGLGAVRVNSAGAIIDTNGKEITIAQDLLDGGGGGGLLKEGEGTLNLAGVNTYTGTTTVRAGALGGSGTITGPVVVEAGGTLAPELLSINNSLVLSGTALMRVSRDGGTPASDRVIGVTTLTFGGTLRVVLSGTEPLQVDDTFDLFDAVSTQTQGFDSLDLPAGYTWDTSRLNIDGTLRVIGIGGSGPEFGPPARSGDKLVLTGTGGTPAGAYTILSSDDVHRPVTEWGVAGAGTFDGSGGFSSEVTINAGENGRYYLLRTP